MTYLEDVLYTHYTVQYKERGENFCYIRRRCRHQWTMRNVLEINYLIVIGWHHMWFKICINKKGVLSWDVRERWRHTWPKSKLSDASRPTIWGKLLRRKLRRLSSIVTNERGQWWRLKLSIRWDGVVISDEWGNIIRKREKNGEWSRHQ